MKKYILLTDKQTKTRNGIKKCVFDNISIDGTISNNNEDMLKLSTLFGQDNFNKARFFNIIKETELFGT